MHWTYQFSLPGETFHLAECDASTLSMVKLLFQSPRGISGFIKSNSDERGHQKIAMHLYTQGQLVKHNTWSPITCSSRPYSHTRMLVITRETARISSKPVSKPASTISSMLSRPDGHFATRQLFCFCECFERLRFSHSVAYPRHSVESLSDWIQRFFLGISNFFPFQ